MFHWLEMQVLCLLAVLVPAAEVPNEHALDHFAWAALAASTVTLNVTELWPPDTGPGPGANTIKQIRNLRMD